MNIKEINAVLESMNDEFIDFWKKISEIESFTEDKDGVDAVGKIFADRAAQRGWKVETHREEKAGDCIAIIMNGEEKEEPVVFSGHMDTVYKKGTLEHMPVRIDNNRMYGPGVTDCKGGITAALMAMEALDIAGYKKRPVILLLQSDEENGNLFSEKRTVGFMIKKAQNAIAFINCEPNRKGAVAVTRKGNAKYRFTVRGKAAHASNCYLGASAIKEAAFKIIELEKLQEKDGITVSCGRIEGGSADNSVPELCTFTADVRFSSYKEMEEAAEHVSRIAETVYVEGTTCDVERLTFRRPMEETESNRKLFDKVNEILEKNSMKAMKGEMSRGGSDASDITYAGIPCMDSMGVTGRYIHSAKEYADIESLKEAAARLAVIAINL